MRRPLGTALIFLTPFPAYLRGLIFSFGLWSSAVERSGGYGDPLERDPEAVLGDVLDGYVTVAGARANYGVVIDQQSLTIDHAATAELRRSMAAVK